MKIKLSLFAFILFDCTNTNKVSTGSEKNKTETTKDSLAYMNDTLLNQKDNRLEDTFKIVKQFEPVSHLTITKQTKQFKIQDYDFKIYWNDKFSYNENLKKHIGGINKIIVLKNNKLIQQIDSVPDENGFGEININIADYNFDGVLDFTLPLGSCGKSCNEQYYLFELLKHRE